jgi:hypothetical protein
MERGNDKAYQCLRRPGFAWESTATTSNLDTNFKFSSRLYYIGRVYVVLAAFQRQRP